MESAPVEVDELFDDEAGLEEGAPLSLSLQGAAAEGISHLLDDLHRTSAERKKVAWSSSGCIAAIRADLQSVSIRYLVLSGSQPDWHLGKEHVINLNSQESHHSGHPLLQLEWSQSGHELVVTDAVGRFTIIGVSNMALSVTTTYISSVFDREDELGQALALHWFNLDRRQIWTFTHAVKREERWSYLPALRKPTAFAWPRAVLAVTRSGSLAVYYQSPIDSRWATVKAKLRDPAPSSILTHAAVSRIQENKLLIVVQNSTRQVSVYLAIFEVPDHKTWSPGNMEIKISIANIIPVVPYGSSAESGGHVGEGLHQGAKSHLISHLDVIPPTDFQKTAQQPPTILIFLTPSVNAMGVTTADQSWSTVVKRWQITSMERKLHPTFQAMESTAARNQADPTTSLHRLPDVVINDVVTNIHKIEANDQIALSFADGSCALYDSASFKPISSSLDTAEVHNLAQGGYIFPLNLGGLDVAISSNGSVSANVNKAGSMQLTHLEHTSQLVLGSSGESDADTTRVAVILACNRSIYLPTSSNDLLLLIRKQFPSQDHPQLVQSILKGLVEDAIFEPDLKHSNLTAKSAAMRLLGLAACLGQDAATGQRSRASMLSWLILALRSCNTILIAILFSIGKTQGLDWKDDHVCEYAMSNIRWALDLCKFVVDEGFDIDDEECHGDLENSELAGRQNRTETQFIAQLLLLSCWSRCMLMGIPWVLRKIAHHISLPQSPLAPEAAPAFARMVSLFQKSPLNVQHLEQFFSNTQSVMKQVHQSSGVSAETWADAERFLLARGQIPEPMQGAMPQILQNALRPYRDKIDRLRLYIHDYAWLGIGQDSKTKAFHRDYIVDVHRKSIVAKKDLGRVRRCVRCGSISTDVVRNRNWPLQVQMVMTRCVCEDSFEIVESEELD